MGSCRPHSIPTRRQDPAHRRWQRAAGRPGAAEPPRPPSRRSSHHRTDQSHRNPHRKRLPAVEGHEPLERTRGRAQNEPR
eukprot:523590-Prymnesium_polylepis.2